jgi:hypothetical protein
MKAAALVENSETIVGYMNMTLSQLELKKKKNQLFVKHVALFTAKSAVN